MSRGFAAYSRYQNFIERILFPLFLALYPLIGMRRGIDVADTAYSLSNFQYFASMDGTWMVATYLSNVAGSLLMHLPYGGTLAGMYFYTSFIQSLLAVGVYEAFDRMDRIPAPLVFLGEWIALGLCWCPSTVLYNYLTYLLMAAALLLLYRGIPEQNRKCYVAAGICLGLNVAVRMPNVVQAAFIVAVWYGTAVYGRKWQQAVSDTLWCMAGYLAGFGIPFVAICIRYGIGAYPAMVRTMFAMTEQAADYKPTAMLTGMFGDYVTGAYWLLYAVLTMAGGWLLFWLQKRWFPQRKSMRVLCVLVYGAVLVVLLRFYWGRGMFHFRYYEPYGSIYYPAVLFLLTAVCACVCCLVQKQTGTEQKLLAALVLVQIFVTPLGSNNALFPMINNLFLVVPFVLWVGYDRLAGGRHVSGTVMGAMTGKKAADGRRIVMGMPFVLLVAFVLVQSVGFHACFVFQDGIYGEARDRTVDMPAKAAGVYTNADNGACLEELAAYVQQAQLTGREVILYGEVPGLGYFLDMPSALSTFWPDLDSYRMAEYERDMAQLETPPVVIVSSAVAAYLNEDAEGMEWFGVDREKLAQDAKLQRLGEYLRAHGYRETFGNARYVVYVTEA